MDCFVAIVLQGIIFEIDYFAMYYFANYYFWQMLIFGNDFKQTNIAWQMLNMERVMVDR